VGSGKILRLGEEWPGLIASNCQDPDGMLQGRGSVADDVRTPRY
jgi:hypothetical protein